MIQSFQAVYPVTNKTLAREFSVDLYPAETFHRTLLEIKTSRVKNLCSFQNMLAKSDKQKKKRKFTVVHLNHILQMSGISWTVS